MEKKKFKMPHSYVIIFMLLIAVSIMTYLIPANEYDRVKNESSNTTVVVESYHAVDGEPVPVWKIPNFVMQGLSKQADIIFPLLVIAGSLEVILSTGMFHAYCGRMAMKCKGKEKLFPLLRGDSSLHHLVWRALQERSEEERDLRCGRCQ